MHPHVVTGAMSREPSTVASKPALQLSAFHSDDVAKAIAEAIKSQTQLSEGLDDPRLDRECDCLGERRLVSEIVQRREHIDPSLVP